LLNIMSPRRLALVSSILGAALSACSSGPQGVDRVDETRSAITRYPEPPLDLPSDPNWAMGITADSVPLSRPLDVGGATAWYACRGYVNEGWLVSLQVGTTAQGWGYCAVAYGSQALQLTTYQTLVSAWTPATDGAIPAGAVPYGEEHGNPLYICRATDDRSGSVHPGKVGNGIQGCDYPFGGQEITAQSYEVLTNPSDFGEQMVATPYPFSAMPIGADIGGTPLYSCAVSFNGATQLGKTQLSWSGCDISYGGAEILVHASYTVLSSWFQPTPLDPSKHAFVAGWDVGGQPLGICNAEGSAWGGRAIGQYQSDGTCNYAYQGQTYTIAAQGFTLFAN
jgi:hypothetical protein